MVRLNKNILPDKLLHELFQQFNIVIGKLGHSQADTFLNALLGPEERLMLAKRLAIVVMLQEGYSMYRISQTLKVSPSTVEKTKKSVSKEVYKDLPLLLQQHKADYQKIVSLVETLLSAGGIMPRYGKARLPKG